MPGDVIYGRAREDIDALDARIGTDDFLMGSEPRSIDAAVASILRHIIDTPFNFDTKDYGAGKSNLTDYLDRMKARFDV